MLTLAIAGVPPFPPRTSASQWRDGLCRLVGAVTRRCPRSPGRRQLPARCVDEFRGGNCQPLGDAHSEPHSDGEASPPNTRQLALVTGQQVRQRLPGETLGASASVHRVVERTQVPSESTVRPGGRQCNPSAALNGMRLEVIGFATDPAQHEERMLAGDVVPPLHPSDGLDGDGVGAATAVELRGLRPNCFRNLWPTECPLCPLTVQRLEEATSLEISGAHTTAGVTGLRCPHISIVALTPGATPSCPTSPAEGRTARQGLGSSHLTCRVIGIGHER